jgi:hypothetical protein
LISAALGGRDGVGIFLFQFVGCSPSFGHFGRFVDFVIYVSNAKGFYVLLKRNLASPCEGLLVLILLTRGIFVRLCL